MKVVDSLDEIAHELAGAQTIALCGHHHPDGDCIGCVCALTHLLRSLGKQVQPLLCTTEKVDDTFQFLVDVDDFIPARSYTETPDVFLALDISGRNRLKDAGAVLERARVKLSIDHHENPDDIWDLCFDDPSAAATGMLVWDLAGLLGFTPDAQFATACYVATMTDTGCFQYQNTDARTFRMAAQFCDAGVRPSDISAAIYQNRSLGSIRLESLMFERMQLANDGKVAYSWLSDEDFEPLGAVRNDAEHMIDKLRTMSGPRVVFILRASGNDVRGSIRAKDDTDVASVAAKLGGGGHRAAAGFVLQGTVESAIGRVLALLEGI
jgi:phosphoesterase RecJ-like protein